MSTFLRGVVPTISESTSAACLAKMQLQLQLLTIPVASALVSPAAKFHRSTDLLSFGPAAEARDVVNVLGRWELARQWEQVGELKEMDKMFDANGNMRAKQPAQQSSGLLAKKKGNGDWVQKTPERRGFCLKQGLVQRYWMGQNVGLLPFRSKALAESVGCTVAELNVRRSPPATA